MGLLNRRPSGWDNLIGQADGSDAARGVSLGPNGTYPIGLDQWAQQFSYQGLGYSTLSGMNPVQTTMQGEKAEPVDANFPGYAKAAYERNGVVFACMLVRLLLFSEARFQYQQMRGGRPGDLFGSADLAILEEPWTNGTTGDLLTRLIQDADLAGNAFIARRARSLARLRPDWVQIILASRTDSMLDAEVIGYLYQHDGFGSEWEPEVLLPEVVAHFAPTPDPLATYRGMSWLTPIIREVMADGAATNHKLRFFENAATPNLAVSLPREAAQTPEQFQKWRGAMESTFKARYAGEWNAYETMFLGGGADLTVVGADMKQLDFKVTQGAGETRIAAAAGVPPVIVGLSEGLEAATYSNYGQARRRLVDLTMRPLWRQGAAALQKLIRVPAGARLWYDDRDIPALKEDVTEQADIAFKQAQTMRQLIEAGYTPESVTNAVTANDLRRLVHSGMVSVQLQAPGSQPVPASSNGNGTLPTVTA